MRAAACASKKISASSSLRDYRCITIAPRMRWPKPMRWCSWLNRDLRNRREVARAFARSERTVRRYQQRYAEGGMAALGRAAGWRRGRRRIRGKRLRIIERLKSEGLSNRAIAQRLGVNEKAIRKLVGAVEVGRRPSNSTWPRSASAAERAFSCAGVGSSEPEGRGS